MHGIIHRLVSEQDTETCAWHSFQRVSASGPSPLHFSWSQNSYFIATSSGFTTLPLTPQSSAPHLSCTRKENQPPISYLKGVSIIPSPLSESSPASLRNGMPVCRKPGLAQYAGLVAGHLLLVSMKAGNEAGGCRVLPLKPQGRTENRCILPCHSP